MDDQNAEFTGLRQDGVHLIGEDAHPLYKFLKHAKPGSLGWKAIKWNFTKFLTDRNGAVIGRYSPLTRPEQLAVSIEALL